MAKKLALALAAHAALFLLLTTPSFAASPTDNYILDNFFPLFRFINPPDLKVYENLDSARADERMEIIEDTRYYGECTKETARTCTGTVTLRNIDTGATKVINPANGSCAVPKDSEDGIGECNYTKTASFSRDIGATDFSKGKSQGGNAFPKLQNERDYYTNVGSNNPLTWGSTLLSTSTCEQAEKQAIVCTQAAQTKKIAGNGTTWPLGWVDWENSDNPTKKPISDICAGLESSKEGRAILSAGEKLTEAHDQFLLSRGKTRLDVSAERSSLCSAVTDNREKAWLEEFLTLPLYGPAEVKGYARGSICVLGICFAGPTSQKLYTDPTIRQTTGAALDTLFRTQSQKQIEETLSELYSKNPLLPYTQISSGEAVPDAIESTLEKTANPATKSLPDNFTLSWLGDVYDYRKKMQTFGYKLTEDLKKETAGAVSPTSTNILSVIFNTVVDSIASIQQHLITIPEPMGQSLAEIQEPVYGTRDTLKDIEATNLKKLSNIVEDTAGGLLVGKGTAPGDALRRLGLYTCSDNLFSAHDLSSIESYALRGERIGCELTSPSALLETGGVCNDFEYVKNNINAAISQAVSRYSNSFPPGRDIKALLFAIYAGESADWLNGIKPYVCEENSVGAAGPFQIKQSSYKLVTNSCASEYSSTDLGECHPKIGTLSRCNVYDAAEIAVRVLLFSGGAWIYTPGMCDAKRATEISTDAKLYEAVCNYGEGTTNLSDLGLSVSGTYCSFIYNNLGWQIPASP